MMRNRKEAMMRKGRNRIRRGKKRKNEERWEMEGRYDICAEVSSRLLGRDERWELKKGDEHIEPETDVLLLRSRNRSRFLCSMRDAKRRTKTPFFVYFCSLEL